MWKRMKEAGKSAREEEEAMKSTRKSTREDAEEEARKSAGEEDWMGERARGMCPRVKGGLWKRGGWMMGNGGAGGRGNVCTCKIGRKY